MKFTCSRTDLIEVIDALAKITPNKIDVPIHSGVYINAEGSTLELQTNNNNIGMIVKIPVNVEVSGSIVVVAKQFQNVIHSFSGDEITVTFEEDRNRTNIKCDSAEFSLSNMSADAFSKVKRIDISDEISNFKLNAIVLKKLIQKTAFACANDSNDTRIIYTGCNFVLSQNKISMAATNTHRLAVMQENLNDNTNELNVIVPAKVLKDIMPLLYTSEKSDDVDIHCSQQNISFQFGDYYINSRLIDGKFPAYENIIPKESTTIARINVNEMKAAISRISLISKFTSEKNVDLDFNEDGLLISALSYDIMSSGTEKINAQIEGEPLKISFNFNYLLDVLNVMESKEFIIKLKTAVSPADIRETDSDDFIYIVTPLRMSRD